MGIEHMHDVQFIGTRQILKGPNRFIRMIGTVDSEQNFHNITFSLSVCGCRHPVFSGRYLLAVCRAEENKIYDDRET
jgi:hypothetical protein